MCASQRFPLMEARFSLHVRVLGRGDFCLWLDGGHGHIDQPWRSCSGARNVSTDGATGPDLRTRLKSKRRWKASVFNVKGSCESRGPSIAFASAHWSRHGHGLCRASRRVPRHLRPRRARRKSVYREARRESTACHGSRCGCRARPGTAPGHREGPDTSATWRFSQRSRWRSKCES